MMKIQHAYASTPTALFKEGLLQSFSPLQKKILVIALVAFALLVVFFSRIARSCAMAFFDYFRKDKPGMQQKQDPRPFSITIVPGYISRHGYVHIDDRLGKDFENVEKYIEKVGKDLTYLDLGKLQLDRNQFEKLLKHCPKLEQKLNPQWINDHPEVPLGHLGFSCFDRLEEFLEKQGHEVTSLNLRSVDWDDMQCEKLIKHCPKLNHVCIISRNITDKVLEHLKGMPLRSVDFSYCYSLTDQGLEHLKGMPLTHVYFDGCNKLTDKALESLKGMSLQEITFSHCDNLTDSALENLKGMQLTNIGFAMCSKITSKALQELIKGMPAKSIHFTHKILGYTT